MESSELMYTYVNKMYINISTIVCRLVYGPKEADRMTSDIMIRVPKELKNRFENLEKKESWKGFASFVREAIRYHLDHHEEIDRANNRKS